MGLDYGKLTRDIKTAFTTIGAEPSSSILNTLAQGLATAVDNYVRSQTIIIPPGQKVAVAGPIFMSGSLTTTAAGIAAMAAGTAASTSPTTAAPAAASTSPTTAAPAAASTSLTTSGSIFISGSIFLSGSLPTSDSKFITGSIFVTGSTTSNSPAALIS